MHNTNDWIFIYDKLTYMLITETLNLSQKVYQTKTGKNPLLVFIDNKESTDDTYQLKDKLKEYGMEWLPSKLGKYAPHSWGWIIWPDMNGSYENSNYWPIIKKFANEVNTFETVPEEGQTRSSDDVISRLEPAYQEILKSIQAAEGIQIKGAKDADMKRKIESFKVMIKDGLESEKTQQFLENMIKYRAELRKHNSYNLGWLNVMLAYFARNGKASVIRPTKEWEQMGYQPKQGIDPIRLLGKGYKHTAYTEEEKAKIIQSYLERKGVNSVDELPESSKYDLYNRKLKGKVVPGSEYEFGYDAWDIQDVEPIPGRESEVEPEEPADNWWWSKVPADEKDNLLCQALISFASSNECGNIKINLDNTRYDLDGARGNATSVGDINLINDEWVKFPTLVHELCHQLRHWMFASGNNPALKRFYNRNANREIREQEAELCSAYVSASFGYNIRHQCNYLKNWGLSKENINQVFGQLADTANFIEQGIEKYLNINKDNQENQ